MRAHLNISIRNINVCRREEEGGGGGPLFMAFFGGVVLMSRKLFLDEKRPKTLVSVDAGKGVRVGLREEKIISIETAHFVRKTFPSQ